MPVTRWFMPMIDDMHIHLRNDDNDDDNDNDNNKILEDLLRPIIRYCRRGMIMPNLDVPICTVNQAIKYYKRIMLALNKLECDTFIPLMTLCLTQNTTIDDIRRAALCPYIYAITLYPYYMNNDNNINEIEDTDERKVYNNNMKNNNNKIMLFYDVFKEMERTNMILLIHAEVYDTDIDIFDREAVFINQVMPEILDNFPTLKIVLEHISTIEALHLVKNTPGNRLSATITAHHLLFNRNHIFKHSEDVQKNHQIPVLNSNFFCLPILKSEHHRKALVEAVINDKTGKFFLGSDSSPQYIKDKEKKNSKAGCYTSYRLLEMYLEAIDPQNKSDIEQFKNFACYNASKFYNLPSYEDSNENNHLKLDIIELENEIPGPKSIGKDHKVIPLGSGKILKYSVIMHKKILSNK